MKPRKISFPTAIKLFGKKDEGQEKKTKILKKIFLNFLFAKNGEK